MAIAPTHIAVTILLTMLTALGPISTDLYLPALPDIQQEFATTVSTVQLTLSIYMIAFAIAQLFVGPLSDQFGRRNILLYSISLYFLASIGCVFITTIDGLIVGRLFQALGACGGIVISRAVIRDVYTPKQAAKLMSYMGTAMALAPAIGPILGGIITVYFGWSGNFILLSIFGGGCLLGITLLLPETNMQKDPYAFHPKQMLRNFKEILSTPVFIGFMLACLFTYAGLFAWISGSSFVFIDVLGVSPDQFGYVFAGMVIGYMVGTQLGGRNVHNLGMIKLVMIGVILEALGGISMFLFVIQGYAQVSTILGAMFIYAIGMGLVLPNSVAAAVSPFPGKAGTASSLMGFIQYSGAAFVGLAVGHGFDQSAWPMAFAIALMGGLALTSFVIFLKYCGKKVTVTLAQ